MEILLLNSGCGEPR